MSKYKKNKVSFGYQTCNCGQHTSLAGDQTPLQLAQIYAWYKDRMPQYLNDEKRAYLESYERVHDVIDRYIFGKERNIINEMVEEF